MRRPTAHAPGMDTVAVTAGMEKLLPGILTSASLGALIGLIRQWSDLSDDPASRDDFGGVRTYTLWAMVGCIAAHASAALSPLLLPVALAALALQQVVARQAGQPAGNTRFAAFVVTVLVGALVAWNERQAAVLVAGLAMVILASKKPLHDWTRRFTEQDIRATLQFVAITGVVLPLVPDRTFGPWGGFNPYATWMMVILISGLGFVGYVAMRILGARAGLLVTSLLGGLASSTATTLAFSRRSREAPEWSAHFAFAVVAACTVMVPRVALAIAVVSPALALRLAPTLAALIIPALLYGVIWWRRRAGTPAPSELPLHNPLGLGTSIKFALLYAVIAFLIKAVIALEWNAGLLPLSFASGLTDMDAISLSLANSREAGSVALETAALAVTLAAVANTLMKAALALTLGSPGMRRPVVTVLGLTAAVGIAAAWLQP
ncbi:MAG: MgtC/SapB family protein [Verrucomicrobia bacterium]|nr:MgtC/SapB family protein [Verrucomicrobiota bacterium]